MNKRLLKKCEQKLKDLEKAYKETINEKETYESSSEVIDLANRENAIQSSIMLKQRALRILPEIKRALHRIKEGTYGICEITGEEIEKKRLLAVPWTRISMKAHEDLVAS